MGVSHFSATSGVFSVMAVDASAGDVTLTKQEVADNTIFDVTGVKGSGAALIFPSAPEGKIIIVRNEDAADDVTVKVTGQTGVAVGEGKTAILKSNGTDFERVTADA
jgi:hypothetical protein